MTNFKKMLLSTAAAGLVAVAVTPASAGEVEKSMSVSGRVNQVFIVSDNGDKTMVGVAESGVSPSRLTVKSSAKSESMTVGAMIELSTYSGFSDTTAASNPGSAGLRVAAVSMSNNMGTLHLGQTSTATDGLLWRGFSASGNGGGWQGTPLGSEQFHVKNNTGTVDSGITVGGVLPGYAQGRDSLVGYSSPSMNGFSAKATLGASSGATYAVFYDADFDGTKVAVSVGGGSATGTVDGQFGGSAAIALAGGFTASVGYSEEDKRNDAAATADSDGSTWGMSVGYNMGANGVKLFYAQGENSQADGDEGTGYGLTFEHSMADYGASVYAGIQNTEYETAAGGTQYDDITAGWVGIRVNF